MNRERVLKVALVLVGLLFLAGVYFLTVSLWQRNQSEVFAQMMASIYVTLGVFVLLAARNPLENRSLIAFPAWSSLALAGEAASRASFRCGGVVSLSVLPAIGERQSEVDEELLPGASTAC